jgi:hypothetical protein
VKVDKPIDFVDRSLFPRERQSFQELTPLRALPDRLSGSFWGISEGEGRRPARTLAAGDKSSVCWRTAVGRHVMPTAIGVDVADVNSNARQDVERKLPLEIGVSSGASLTLASAVSSGGCSVNVSKSSRRCVPEAVWSPLGVFAPVGIRHWTSRPVLKGP